MELSFVTAALRRRWWVVLIFAQLGVLPLVFGSSPVSSTFESTALIAIVVPDDARVTGGSPDRYVLSQMEVLQSRSVAEEVALELGDVDQAGPILRASEFEQLVDTDIVSVQVRQDDAERARLIAQTIVDTYVDRLVAAELATREPDLASYGAELTLLRQQLELANETIREAAAPYLARVGEVGFTVPDIRLIAPQALIDQELLTAEIKRIEQVQGNLENEPSAINSRVVQPATLPTTPVIESSGLTEIAFLVAMILLGIVVALLWARFSAKVLDEVAAEEIVGVPVVAKVKRSRSLKQNPLVALTRLPQELISVVDQVSVRAEALAKIDQPLRVAVIGSQRGAGTTTLALAMAARYAAAEYSVVVVDADRRDPWLTDAFGAVRHGGIPALLGTSSDGADRIFTRTSEPDVRVLGLGRKGTALRRESMPALVESVSAAANVIIFDGGPLLDAASTVELCNEVDAVVLAVPLSDQRSDDLVAVARQLNDIRSRVLPVITEPVGRLAHRVSVQHDPGGDNSTRAEPVPAAASTGASGRAGRSALTKDSSGEAPAVAAVATKTAEPDDSEGDTDADPESDADDGRPSDDEARSDGASRPDDVPRNATGSSRTPPPKKKPARTARRRS